MCIVPVPCTTTRTPHHLFYFRPSRLPLAHCLYMTALIIVAGRTPTILAGGVLAGLRYLLRFFCTYRAVCSRLPFRA